MAEMAQKLGYQYIGISDHSKAAFYANGLKEDRVLAQWLDRLTAKRVPAEIQLDVLEAAGRRGTAELRDRLTKYQAAQPKGVSKQDLSVETG